MIFSSEVALVLFRVNKLILVSIYLLSSSWVAAQPSPVPGEPETSGNLEIIHVQGQVWLIAGAGGNIAVQAGEQGVLVVDTGANGFGQEIVDTISKISDRPIRYIINTSVASSHIGGNAELASLPGGATSENGNQGARINVIAQENVLFRMSVARSTTGEQIHPQVSWPTDGYFEGQRGQVFNGEAIDIIHMPSAYSDGDSVVYFRGSNVLVSGDIFTTTSLPLINYELGGSFQGSIEALDRMLDITVSADLAEGGTYIIPGHGYISDEAELVEYRDMTYIIRDRLQKLIEEGQTLEQVKLSRPILGWEGRYSRPEWSVDAFLEAIYSEYK